MSFFAACEPVVFIESFRQALKLPFIRFLSLFSRRLFRPLNTEGIIPQRLKPDLLANTYVYELKLVRFKNWISAAC
jgi:hypothetical protein